MSISILCANYNNSIYLDDFFSSIENSTLRPNEIVFVDDGSTDDSLTVVSKYEKRLNIKTIKLAKNIGFANALNAGIEFCTAKYIARIDPDDKLAPTRLRMQFDYMESHPEVGVLGSQAQYFLSETGKLLVKTNMPKKTTSISSAYYRGDNGVLHGTTMIRTSVLSGIRYIQSEVPSEDYGFFCRLMASGVAFANINETLTLVRVHSNSVSNNLPLETVAKVFRIREETLGIKQSKIKTRLTHLSLRSYRNYLFEKNKSKKLAYLFTACLFGPSKLIRRLTRA